MIHRSDKRIRARSSVDRDLVLRAIPSVLFSSMDETVMESKSNGVHRWRVSASETFLRTWLCSSISFTFVWGNSSRTLSRDVYKLTMQSDRLSGHEIRGHSLFPWPRRRRRREITFLLFRGRGRQGYVHACGPRRRKTCVTTIAQPRNRCFGAGSLINISEQCRVPLLARKVSGSEAVHLQRVAFVFRPRAHLGKRTDGRQMNRGSTKVRAVGAATPYNGPTGVKV